MLGQVEAENPYAAPGVEPDPVVPSARRIRVAGWAIKWTLVFGANLVVPVMFSNGMGGTAGIYAIAGGVVVAWVLGLLACARWLPLRPILNVGGICVAISQVMPILQIMAGLIGLSVAGMLVGYGGANGEFEDHGLPAANIGPLGLFLATLLTGVGLIAASLAVGALLVGIARLIFGPPRPAGLHGPAATNP